MIKMSHLKSSAQYKLMIAAMKLYCKNFIMIQSLKLHFRNILAYPNLSTFHIFCLNETIIQNIYVNQRVLKHFKKGLNFCHVIMNMEQ
jgi:hypothetical protein